ncbi:hypothetical protein MYX75_06435 [Acidobacteria bacterium AH-259-A15]|nr:hypothetical protein [Acidobacteria bacterium AH-259-A15]
MKREVGAKRYLLGKAVDSQNTWESIEEVAFFALPPDRRGGGAAALRRANLSCLAQPNGSACPGLEGKAEIK